MAEASATRKHLVSELKESVAALQQMVQSQQRALPGLGDKMAQLANDIDADDKRIGAVETLLTDAIQALRWVCNAPMKVRCMLLSVWIYLVLVMMKKHTVPHQNGQQQPLPLYV